MVSNKDKNPWATKAKDAKGKEPFKKIVMIILVIALVVYFIGMLEPLVQVLIYVIMVLLLIIEGTAYFKYWGKK